MDREDRVKQIEKDRRARIKRAKKLKRQDRLVKVVAGLIIGLGGIVLVAGLWALMLAFTSIGVAAAWNWFGLHDVFHSAPLSFWHVLAVAQVVLIARSIFNSSDDGFKFNFKKGS